MPLQLLQTKFYIPPAHAGLVPRPRLVQRLDEGLRQGSRLTLISAPAGSGKTSLLSEWAQGKDKGEGIRDKENLYPLSLRPYPLFAWLSLDAEDNDPVRYWSYVTAAVQKVRPEIGAGFVQSLQAAPLPPPDALLTPLINDLAGLDQGLILVLDDYHAIKDPSIHAAMGFFVEHLPPPFHLVIASRQDPPLPVVRLRARRQLTELRNDDLRFRAPEAASFLNEVMGLNLDPGDVAALEARTEGWIVGLQMAALSMQGREDVSAFLQTFSGTHRHILDYLLEEVLARQTEEVQQFLLQTSILDRMCASLADALLENRDPRIESRPQDQASLDDSRLTNLESRFPRDESRFSTLDSRSTIEYIDRSNLFLVPLDDRREWYRYHHLFADLLRARLQHEQPERIPVLHRRASAWLDENEYPNDAIRHALAGGDHARAERLVVRHWRQYAHRGEVSTTLAWLQALPDAMIRNSPVLSADYCWVLFLRGQAAELEIRLQDTVRALEAQQAAGTVPAGDPEYQSLPAQIEVLSAYLARHKGDLQRAIEHAERGLRLVPPDNAVMHGIGHISLAHAYRDLGSLALSAHHFRQSLPHLQAGGNIVAITTTHFYLAQLLRLQGRLREAEQTLVDGLRLHQEPGYARLPAFGILYAALGDILREQNRLGEAQHRLDQGDEIGKPGAFLDFVKTTGIGWARLKQAREAWDEALEAFDSIERTLERLGALQHAIDEARAYHARLLIRLGRLDEAAPRLEKLRPVPGQRRPLVVEEVVALTFIRFWIAKGEAGSALEEVDRHLHPAEAEGRQGSLMELLMLRAAALDAQGNEAEARQSLLESLSLAAPEGYARLYLDEGEPVSSLLEGLRKSGLGQITDPAARTRLETYLDELLGAPSQEGEKMARSTAGLVEPLTSREMEVLRLLSTGLSNQEIAEKLVISLPTVKKHAGSIFGKLGVSSRTQAIARAREVGLV